jgi:hypothetical protein
MQKRVPKRDRATLAQTWRGDFRNSESSCWLDLVKTLPVWPKDLSDRSTAGRRNLIAIIEREMRKERRLGLAGSRAYDLARHAKLVRLLKEERHELVVLHRKAQCEAAHSDAATRARADRFSAVPIE